MRNETVVHEEQYKGCTIKLVLDDHPESPREWDNVGTMACWCRGYNLGDLQPSESPEQYFESLVYELATKEESEWLERAESLYRSASGASERRLIRMASAKRKEILKRAVVMPLYLYDHSGLSMSTSEFSCPWDSGQVGYIHCSLEKARAEWKGTDEEVLDKARKCLEGEVETYSTYLEGNIVGYVAEDECGSLIDSCWGYYPEEGGGFDYAIEEAKGAIDGHLEKEQERTEREEKLAHALAVDECKNI